MANPSSSTIRIRPFEPADYAPFAAVQNVLGAIDPEYRPITADGLRESNERAERMGGFHLRVVAERPGGTWLGCGALWCDRPDADPPTYVVGTTVHPNLWPTGIRARLYHHLLAEARRRGAKLLRPYGSARRPASLTFWRRHGFKEVQRRWESRLVPSSFDFAPFAGAEDRVTSQGIAPESFFLAVDSAHSGPTGHYVGVSCLYRHFVHPDELSQSFAGVLRSHRGRGIALALKLRCVAYAARAGAKRIRTYNDARNRPMLRINQAMGWHRQPALYIFEKPL